MAKANQPISGLKATPTKAPTSGQPDGDPIALLQSVKESLQATRRKLLRVQPDTLDDVQHEQWSEEIFQLNLAISNARNALLGVISAEFAAELPAIEQATGKLADDLSHLQASVDIINAIGSALNIIANIALLAA